MDWLSLESLGTVAGAALAVSLVTAIIKSVGSGAISGRITQLVALGLSLIVAYSTNPPGNFQAGLVAFFNGLIIFAAAVGLDQSVNLEKREGC